MCLRVARGPVGARSNWWAQTQRETTPRIMRAFGAPGCQTYEESPFGVQRQVVSVRATAPYVYHPFPTRPPYVLPPASHTRMVDKCCTRYVYRMSEVPPANTCFAHAGRPSGRGKQAHALLQLTVNHRHLLDSNRFHSFPSKAPLFSSVADHGHEHPMCGSPSRSRIVAGNSS